MKLEHLAPYLPYKLKVIYEHSNKIGTISNIYSIGKGYDDDDIKIAIDYSEAEHLWMFKPILRPLSDLTKEIEHNGEKFVPIEKIGLNSCSFFHTTYLVNKNGYEFEIKKIPYNEFQKLFEWHFDVFGLIEKGEAIDINTI